MSPIQKKNLKEFVHCEKSGLLVSCAIVIQYRTFSPWKSGCTGINRDRYLATLAQTEQLISFSGQSPKGSNLLLGKLRVSPSHHYILQELNIVP